MEKKKKLADESARTQRAREKLRRKLADRERQITPQALEKKMGEIHRWIARHATERVVLKDKAIALFDKNVHAAAVSRTIAKIAGQLRKGPV